jgi:hypothetical protein
MFSLKRLLLFSYMLTLGLPALGQQFYSSSEWGFQLGGSTYFGDLNPNYGMKYIRPGGGVFYRYQFNPYIDLRAVVNYTKVGYDDAFSNNDFQKQRNLSFRSNILEVAVIGEFNFFWFETGNREHRFTPYLAGGIGAFYFEPTAQYSGRSYKLRLLGTEGQNTKEFAGRKYKPYSICFPVGAGFKYWIRPGMNFSFEVLNRFTLTDYMDDVSNTYIGADHFISDPMRPSVASRLQDPSLPVNGTKLGRAGKQRGNNATKDQYLMVQLSLSFQLKTYKCPSYLQGVWQP